MSLIRLAIQYIAPVFIVTSPFTSYADQIYSMHKSRSSTGFSLDIPLIMLTASITKVYYWFGEPYDTSLLIQASVMILIQLALLHVALTNRWMPDPSRDLNTPFAPVRPDRRPYNFWQWRERRPYFLFICYWTLGLGVLQLLLGNVAIYVNTIGYLALAVEATLPVPQVLANQRNKSCRGFRPSVLVNWLIGDAFKMSFFFLSDTTIPWAFKLCGLFQWGCDIYLGVQYLQFGSSST